MARYHTPAATGRTLYRRLAMLRACRYSLRVVTPLGETPPQASLSMANVIVLPNRGTAPVAAISRGCRYCYVSDDDNRSQRRRSPRKTIME